MAADRTTGIVMRVTHRYQFYASHRLHSPELSEQENEAVYGKCNNPYGHGHNYVLEVSIQGGPDPVTGLVANRRDVDELVQTKVLQLFDHRNINTDIAEFETVVPTTENIVLMIARLLDDALRNRFHNVGTRLARVHVQETDRNGFEVLLSTQQRIAGEAASEREYSRQRERGEGERRLT